MLVRISLYSVNMYGYPNGGHSYTTVCTQLCVPTLQDKSYYLLYFNYYVSNYIDGV
jgi:hypothetical protein